jgi:transposase
MLTPCCFPSLGRCDLASTTDVNPQITDDQWFLIEDLFPWNPPQRPGGRPPVPPRTCFEGLLWLLRNGGRWQALPKIFPSESTLRRRLIEWTNSGILTEVWARLVELADELEHIDGTNLSPMARSARQKKGLTRCRRQQRQKDDGPGAHG